MQTNGNSLTSVPWNIVGICLSSTMSEHPFILLAPLSRMALHSSLVFRPGVIGIFAFAIHWQYRGLVSFVDPAPSIWIERTVCTTPLVLPYFVPCPMRTSDYVPLPPCREFACSPPPNNAEVWTSFPTRLAIWPWRRFFNLDFLLEYWATQVIHA